MTQVLFREISDDGRVLPAQNVNKRGDGRISRASQCPDELAPDKADRKNSTSFQQKMAQDSVPFHRLPYAGSLCRKLALTSVRRCEPIDFIAEQLQGFLSHRYKRVMQIATPWLIRLLMDQQQVDHFPLTWSSPSNVTTEKAHTNNLSVWALGFARFSLTCSIVNSPRRCRQKVDCPNGIIPWNNPEHMNGRLGTNR